MEIFLTVVQVLSAFALLGNFVGNALVLAVLCKVKQMQTNTNYLLGSLAASDIQFGVFIFVEIVLYYLLGGNYVTYGFSFQILFRVYVSAFTLAAIAVERYYAILKPFVHRAKMSKKLVVRVSRAIWVSVLPFSTPEWVVVVAGHGHVRNTYNLLAYAFCITVSATVITVCYSKIVYRVWFKTQGSETTNAGVLKSRKNLTKLLVRITSVFFVCWCPLMGRNVVTTAYRRPYMMVSSTLALMGTAANPLLYALHSVRFRRALKKLFGGQRCWRSRSVGDSSLQPATKSTH